MSSAYFIEKLKGKISDITECSICTETMKNPRMLPCVHSFCLKCLQTYGMDKITSDNSISCPHCRKFSTVPTGGFDALPVNHFINKLIDVNMMSDTGESSNPSPKSCDICSGINQEAVAVGFCMECRENLCFTCRKRHGVHRFFKSHKTVALNYMPSQNELLKMAVDYCQFHPTQEVILYCNECLDVACVICYVDKHNEHKCADINKSSNGVIEKCDKDILAMNDLIAETELLIKQFDVTQNEFEQNTEEIEKLITNKFEEVKAKLHSQHKQLMDQLNTKSSQRLKKLQMLKEENDHELVMMKSFKRYWNEQKSKGSACDIVQAADCLNKRAVDLIAKHDQQKKDNFEKVKSGHYRVEFIALNKECYLIGQMKDISSTELIDHPDPASKQPSWRPLLQNSKINTMSSKGVRINGVAICNQEMFLIREGSPNIEVYSCSNFKTLSRQINVPGLTNPVDIVFCSLNNYLFISNYICKQYIHRIDVNSGSKFGWLTQNRKPGGLSITRKHHLLVSCDNVGCIDEYNSSGSLVRSVKIKEGISGVHHCVELKQERLVLTEANSPYRVLLTDLNGKLLRTYGQGCGSTIGQLRQPFNIHADECENLLIVDSENGRLIILSEDLQEFGKLILFQPNFKVRYPGCCILDRVNRRLLVGTDDGSLLSVENKGMI